MNFLASIIYSQSVSIRPKRTQCGLMEDEMVTLNLFIESYAIDDMYFRFSLKSHNAKVTRPVYLSSLNNNALWEMSF